MIKSALASLMLLFCVSLKAQFTQMDPGIPVFSYGHIAPGDYDNDGDPDLFITGENSSLNRAMLYRNDGNWQFTPTAFIFPPFSRGCASWGDFNKDGWLDLAVSGAFNPNAYPSSFKLYRNLQGQGFEEIPTTLPQVQYSHQVWADVFNDGNLDLVFQGVVWNAQGAFPHSGIYRNLGNSQFELLQTNLTPIFNGEIRMADFDGDGDLDLANSGYFEYSYGNFYPAIRVYESDSGDSFQTVTSLALGGSSGIDWFDFGNDGDLDLIFCGFDAATGLRSTRILQNNGSAGFAVMPTAMVGIDMGDVACADYDNDGDNDIFICGNDSDAHSVAKLYRNEGNGVFSETGDQFTSVKHSHACWADLDNDGDLDLMYIGEESLHPNYGDRIRFYRNDQNAANYPPAYPDLSYSPGAGIVIFPSVDDHTPNQCLSYDLRIGTSPGGAELLRPMANPVTGFRRIPEPGRPSFAQYQLAPGTYYLSAQAIDGSWRGSNWGPELMVQTGVENAGESISATALKLQANPNPFRDQIRIGIDAGRQVPVRLEIFNLRGQRIVVLHEGYLPRGAHSLDWNPDPGLGSGIYLLKLSSGDNSTTLRLGLVK
ncbi:MAG: T9SS type A sorting domain-containing protein [Candidatus Cloacimonetes bacterium]|nr:T9SS type A sorting domain-containing protein [Candidatus Cloacimonadota bacterium]